MDFLSEFRRPSMWYSRLAIAVLSLFFFGMLAVISVSGYLVYRMVKPPRSHSEINLQSFPGHPEDLNINMKGEGSRDAWFFPGLKTAPTIILCPAYGSSRGELLTLASALQDLQYNVLTFDFSAHGSSGGRSTLGYHEVEELRAAMDAVANRGDVDVNRFGLWGVSLGAYAALAEAAGDHRVRAVVAESPYGRPEDMVALQVNRSGLGAIPLVTGMSQMIFERLNSQYKNVQPLKLRIGNLSGVPQLYLQSPDDPELAASTAELFRSSPVPHEMATLQHGNYGGMADEEKRNYENRIVSFFLVNLPLSGEPLPEIK
jgi:pimeloyl-ACP methyl ester carboxylesterase